MRWQRATRCVAPSCLLGAFFGHNHLVSNKREWNNFFCLKRPQNIENSSHFIFVKTTDFQLVFNFEQARTITIFGEHGIMESSRIASSNDSVFNKQGNLVQQIFFKQQLSSAELYFSCSCYAFQALVRLLLLPTTLQEQSSCQHLSRSPCNWF